MLREQSGLMLKLRFGEVDKSVVNVMLALYNVTWSLTVANSTPPLLSVKT